MGTAITKETIGIEEKVAFLKQPGNYPFAVKEVLVKETHMSWVFLAGDFVYKLKKPVKYNFLDHLSLASRLNNSLEEIQLNKPLAAGIYIGVIPLVIDAHDKLALEDQGEPVDWLVKMKRIPEKNLLDYSIKHDSVDDTQLQHAAELLSAFYKQAIPMEIGFSQYLKKLQSDISFNDEKLAKPVYGLPLPLIRELTAGQNAFLSSQQSIIKNRIEGKKIIDAHGDLRPEHICLAPQPALIDRLEFCRELRIMDTAEELAYLFMECEMMNNTHVEDVFCGVYSRMTNDVIPAALLKFYKIKKACLRAYLVASHIEEPRYQNDPKWLVKANAYLKLAERIHQQQAN